MLQEKKITKTGKRRLKIVEKAFPRAYNRHAHFHEIKLSGRWLKDMGFDSGKHVIVSHRKNKITITLSKQKRMNEKISIFENRYRTLFNPKPMKPATRKIVINGKIVFLTTLSAFFTLATYGQDSNKSTSWWEQDDFTIRLAVALISALISSIVAYYIYRRNKKNEPIKQISYSLEYSNGLIEVDEKIKSNIKISYNGESIENLSYVKATFENSGNTVIKNQEIRFELTSKSSFKEAFFNPVPKRELFSKDVSSKSLTERIIQIGHLEKGQKVSFHLVTTGENANIEINPYNKEGGVEFKTNQAIKEVTEKETLREFFFIITVLIIVPQLFNLLGLNLSGIVRLIILGFSYRKIIEGINVIVDLIFKNSHRSYLQQGENSIYIQRSEGSEISMFNHKNKEE